MPRAAIYARFSTDLQSERSIDDQVELCRVYAEREGIAIARVYSDKGKSGASIFGRDGLISLMGDAQRGAFDVVIVEHSDRLTRSTRDSGDLFDRFQFLGIELRAVHSGGRLDGTMAGLFGLVGQIQREEGAKKVRRGLAGVVRSGRHAGGRPYGYEAVAGQPGVLRPLPDQAAVVERILTEYVAGWTPREIAKGLNRDRVPPPRGRVWNASTINGNPARGSGILFNELYAGRLVWNKIRMVKNPDTGRRVSRPNAASERQIVEAPHLAIVPIELFEATQARKHALAKVHPSHQKRPRHLLSGLLRCGSCGGGLSTYGVDRTGRKRIRCSSDRENGTCPDPRTFYLDDVERAVLSALRGELRAPDVLAEFVREYHAERQRLAAKSEVDRVKLERRLRDIEGESERVLDMLIHRLGNEERLSTRSKELGNEEAAIRSELERLPDPIKVVALHPAAIARYEATLGRLQEALAAGVEAGSQNGHEALHDLVDSVTVRPWPERRGGVEVEIAGRLNALLGPDAFPNRLRGVCGEMVARDRFGPSAHMESLPYRIRLCR